METNDGPMSTPRKKKSTVFSGKGPTRIRRSPKLLLKIKLNTFTYKEPVVLSDDDEPQPHSEHHNDPHIEPKSQLQPSFEQSDFEFEPKVEYEPREKMNRIDLSMITTEPTYNNFDVGGTSFENILMNREDFDPFFDVGPKVSINTPLKTLFTRLGLGDINIDNLDAEGGYHSGHDFGI